MDLPIKVQALQLALYLMAGGGDYGLLAAQQPWAFRPVGRMPYSKIRVQNVQSALCYQVSPMRQSGVIGDELPIGEALREFRTGGLL